MLDDAGTLADNSSSDDEDDDAGAEAAAFDAHRRSRSLAAPLSPLFSPTTWTFGSLFPHSSRAAQRSPAGSVVLRGSQVMSDEDVEDALTGTVHCATVRPIGRDSDSSAAEQPSFGLRPAHLPVGSVGSARSLASNHSSLVTSKGFRDMLSGQGAFLSVARARHIADTLDAQPGTRLRATATLARTTSAAAALARSQSRPASARSPSSVNAA